MKDIDIDTNDLSIPARQTIQIIDQYIDLINEGTVILKQRPIELYWERWDELNTSISRQSGGDYNLSEFTYRGIQIVSWDGA